MKNHFLTSLRAVSILFLIAAFIACENKEKKTETTPVSNSEFESPSFQVGIVVKNLAESLAFYKDVIGMVDSRQFDINAEFGKNSGLSDSIPFKVTALKLEDSPTAPEWKLVAFDTIHLEGFSKRLQDGIGVRYTTLLVKSVAPFLKRFEEHNVKTLGATPMKLPNGKTFILIQDPNGIFIEIIGGD
ncbi:MAG: glyoxalase [Bacteroidetes bacterium HGW-Bacteroidetes-13]|nr:MAG: glyoxalase [Bacteroidetes bacterium HGW-Bacteroidetes-13]